MNLRGSACFDWAFYYKKNEEILQGMNKDDAWAHFVKNGQFAGEAFRCAFPLPHVGGCEIALQHLDEPCTAFRFSCDNPLDDPAIAE